MRLSSYLHSGRSSYGVVLDTGIVELGSHIAGAPTLRDFLALAPIPAVDQIIAAGPVVPFAEIVFEPVIPNPDKIICVGLNYNEHVAETNHSITEYPVLFARFAGSQIGHERPLIRPKVSHEFDYEAELAVVIGRGGRDIAGPDALDHVGGYTCYNDASVRDWQRHTTQFLPGKTFAGTGAMGPWLVTPDEVGDPASLDIEMRLNGEVMQKANTSLLIHSIPSLIRYVSMILPLLPGDVIVTGTPGGVGARRNPQVWLKPGDVAEVEISRIGTLANRVVAE